MAENKEIKLSNEAVESAKAKLTGSKETLVGARNNIITANENMKKDWLGDGGTAFILSANILEAKFLERINDLLGEINDLDTAKKTLFGLDSYLAKSISGAIITDVVKPSALVAEKVVSEKSNK